MKEKQGKILIIDDNAEFLIALKILLSPYFEKVVTEVVPDRIPLQIKQEKFDVILLDMNFKAGINSGNEGFFWMQKIREYDEEANIVFITAYGDVDVAIKSLKEGAIDFIQKTWDDHKILSAVLSALKLSISRKEIHKLKDQQLLLRDTLTNEIPPMIRGKSKTMEEIFKVIEKVAHTDANILITGESGTGKEVLAREIHRRSGRNEGLFVMVDLGAIHANLFESELFGHSKGAFTDAKQHKPGRLELAAGGTLFMDEISNLPIELQTKLLSVIQSRSVTRLGENNPRGVDFRLICASNVSLEQKVIENSFREDLLYRLKTVELALPPLRNRTEDIPEFLNYYLNIYSEKYQKNLHSVSPNALKKLKKYEWPGNIRELQHSIEKAVILSEGRQLTSADFNLSSPIILSKGKKKSFNLEHNEKAIILKALTAFDWNMTRTAKELGINRSTLYDKLKKYEI